MFILVWWKILLVICERHSERHCPHLCVLSRQQHPRLRIFSSCLTQVSALPDGSNKVSSLKQDQLFEVRTQCDSVQPLLQVLRAQTKVSTVLCSFLEVFWGDKSVSKLTHLGDPSRFHEAVTWVPASLLAVGKASFLLLEASHVPGLTAQAKHNGLQTLHLPAFHLELKSRYNSTGLSWQPWQSPSRKDCLLSVICFLSSTCPPLSAATRRGFAQTLSLGS